MTSATVIKDEAHEKYVQDSFHSFLQTSLAQARAEGLLGVEVFTSAEGEQMIKLLALCFYWAAVQCKTNALSIALPHVGDAATSAQHSKLSRTNCPSTFVPLMNLWSDIVPRIQHLAAERKHKLLLVICGRGPPIPPPVVTVLSEKLRSIAIKMSQLQSFQDRIKVSSIYTPPMPPSETTNAKGNPKMDPTIEPIRETLPPTIADVPESTRHLLDPAASALRLRSRLAHLSQTTWMGAVI